MGLSENNKRQLVLRKKSKIIKSSSKKNRYQENNKKLSLLPWFFFILIIILVISWAIIYIDSLNKKNENTNSPYLASIQQEDFERDNIKNNPEEKSEADSDNTSPSTETPSAPKENKIETKILLKNSEGEKCELNFITKKPPEIKNILNVEIEGWWKANPKNCNDTNLLYIQIVRTNQDEVEKLTNFLRKENIHTLSENDVFAINYSIHQKPINFDLLEYTETLTKPILNNLTFNPASSYDTKRMEDFTYFLNGKCEGQSNNTCKLWRIDNFTGESELIKTNVANTGRGQENELRPGTFLQFADTQDYEDGIKIVYIDSISRTQKVIKLNNQNFEIVQD